MHMHTLVNGEAIGRVDWSGVVKPTNIDIGIRRRRRRRFNSTLQHSSSALADVHTIDSGFNLRNFYNRAFRTKKNELLFLWFI